MTEPLWIALPCPHEGQYGPGWTTLRFRPECRDDPIVIREIWVEDTYRVRGLDKERWRDRPVIDLGANIGAFSLIALAYDACKVISVEPHPDNFKVLTENLGNHPRAERTWPMELAAASRSGLTLPLSGVEGEAHLFGGQAGTEATVPVQTISLAEIMPEGRTGFLKCDIEGAEYDVFAGSDSAVLDRIDRIAMEWHGDEMAPHLQGDGPVLFGQLCAKLAVTHTLDIIGSPERGGMLFARSYTADE